MTTYIIGTTYDDSYLVGLYPEAVCHTFETAHEVARDLASKQKRPHDIVEYGSFDDMQDACRDGIVAIVAIPKYFEVKS